jgi:elongator complex protein 1
MCVCEYIVSTRSVTTGTRKKKEKKKSYLTRKLKEGSPVEEEYLVELLKDIQRQAVEMIGR